VSSEDRRRKVSEGGLAASPGAARRQSEDRGALTVGKLVRLQFHACFAGCHAYLEPVADNNGILPSHIPTLTSLYDSTYASVMSRADFIAAAGNMALVKAQDNAAREEGSQRNPLPVNELEVVFSFGRTDRESLAREGLALPGGHFDLAQMRTFFSEAFGFNDNDIVTLMGAHTLGRARVVNSGFDGP